MRLRSPAFPAFGQEMYSYRHAPRVTEPAPVTPPGPPHLRRRAAVEGPGRRARPDRPHHLPTSRDGLYGYRPLMPTTDPVTTLLAEVLAGHPDAEAVIPGATAAWARITVKISARRWAICSPRSCRYADAD
jgi:hypothetical protein